MEKKTWILPELIVLVRSDPQEAVLTACKSLTGGSSHDGQEASCNYNNFPFLGCNPCSAAVGS